MRKSAFYSDVFFSFLLGFFPLLFYLRFLRLSLFLSFLFALFFGVAVATLFVLFSKKRQKKLFLKKSEEEEQTDFILYLSLLPKEKQQEFFKEHSNCFKSDYALCPLFKFRALTRDDIADWYVSYAEQTAPILLCNHLEEDSEKLLKKLNIPAMESVEIYRILKENDRLPKERFIQTKPQKKHLKKLCFAKSNSKRFLSGGVLLLFSALFIPYSTYYVICGICLLLTALFVRIFGY